MKKQEGIRGFTLFIYKNIYTLDICILFRILFISSLVVCLVFPGLAGSTSNGSLECVSEPVILLTGFVPFGSISENPSELVVRELQNTTVDGCCIYGLVLPVDFTGSVEAMMPIVDSLHPVLILSLGLEAQAHEVHIETLAFNLKKDPSASGSESRLQRIDPEGSFFYSSSLPLRSIVHDLRVSRIPVRQSVFAGTYVCNTVFYSTLKYLADHDEAIPAGFVHLPLLDSQDSQGLNLSTLVEAVRTILHTSLVKNT